MAGDVNRVLNADFSRGRASPSGWRWEASTKGMVWRRGLPNPCGEAGGVTLISRRAKGTGFWSQVAVCKPGAYYRVEATVTCELAPSTDIPAEDGAGVVLAVQPVAKDRPAGERRVTPGLHRASNPIAIRTYYRVPVNVRRIKISIGIVDAKGTACVRDVRFIEILEPEESSHILAIPPPPHTVPAPRVVRRVGVCSATAAQRPVTRLLAEYFGKADVQVLDPPRMRPGELLTDALLLPDPQPPPSIVSLKALLKLAVNRMVVISLPAFARLASGKLTVRRVEQRDDPICAKVVFANYATRGFALHDVFAYAWPGNTAGSFVQNHFRRTAASKGFCDRLGIVPLLTSVCDREVTSDRPVCLYKETSGGGLFVLDIEPVEAVPSTFGEPTLAMHLLLCILGQSQSGLGQYVVPEERGCDFRELIREMAARFEPFVLHEPDLPGEEVTEQFVTIGRADGTYGLPITPKPLILVRTGLTSGDVESVYSAFVWFKQFVRNEPYPCPYARQLASQFRLAWIPCIGDWEARRGWRRGGRPAVVAAARLPQDSRVSLLIDVASSPSNGVGVVLPSHTGTYARYVQWLPRLATAFAAGRHFVFSVGDAETFCDRDLFAWRRVSHRPQFIIDPGQFETEAHSSVRAAGGQVIRIEIPGADADFPACSIARTEWAATMLEHVIGLQYGLIAVNRTASAVHFDGFSPVAPGGALIVDRRDPLLRSDASQAG